MDKQREWYNVSKLIYHMANEVSEGKGDVICVSPSKNPAIASKYEIATEGNDAPVWAVGRVEDNVCVRIFGGEFHCKSYDEFISVLVSAHRPLAADPDIKAFIETITEYSVA